MPRKERSNTGQFAKGNKGRPKGAKNKTTVAAKEAFQMAFDELGGFKELVRWAKDDPDNRKVFYTLYARLIPLTHEGGDGDKPVRISFKDAE